MFDAWHNAPWTERGMIFKNLVEGILIIGAFVLVMGIIGGIEKL